MKIVVVSNRVARVTGDEPIAGGLASALLPAVKNYGAIWVGSSGRLRTDNTKDAFAAIEAFGRGALATVDLPDLHYARYYEGFSNSALWPMLHSRAELIHATREDYNSYCEINAYMARALLRFQGPDVHYWVQDYHFLTLGLELRKRGIKQPIGFFLHTPWPSSSVISAMPHHREIVSAMLAFNLVGFQTEEDQRNFVGYVKNELGLPATGNQIEGPHGTCRLDTFPIGIDVEEFARCATKTAAGPAVSRLRSSLQGSKLAIGVDRLDYSKGLAGRIRAFDRLLTLYPQFKAEISYLQIAIPSRTNIPAYRHLQEELAAIVGEVNGRHSEVDWTPIRYLNRGFRQATLAGFYRAAQVGVVTPFHDGMNLVAKEYVAAQNPFDPGVLVLSNFAGAAKELETALLVNPHDVDEMANQIAKAFTMPLEERRERWEVMMKNIQGSSVHSWFSNFVDALGVPSSSRHPPVEQHPKLDNAISF